MFRHWHRRQSLTTSVISTTQYHNSRTTMVLTSFFFMRDIFWYPQADSWSRVSYFVRRNIIVTQHTHIFCQQFNLPLDQYKPLVLFTLSKFLTCRLYHLQRGKYSTNTSKRSVPGIKINCIWWWDSSSKDLRSEEYTFIVITSLTSLNWLGVLVPIRVPSIGQINLFAN